MRCSDLAQGNEGAGIPGGSSFFRGLDRSAVSAILSKARASRFDKGSVVFHQGGEAQYFYLLVSGRLRVVRTTPDGRQVVVRFVIPGEAFGIAVALGRSTFPASAMAVADSRVLAWPSSAWIGFAADYPVLAANVLAVVGHRLNDAHQRIVEMSTEEVQRRVAHALLHFADQLGLPGDGGPAIELRISRQEVAEFTATSLYSVSRLMSAWAGEGLIESGRQRIRITDRRRLRAIAEGAPR